ncbi:MAG: hypothetical protein A3K06_03750 [Candidatus Doudnabacteria bacterium RIFCSPHIGHO2_01_52_17]|uniref:EamA domain-containing protein n=1 Tax=Candidatus Doudnabacteria bacterium RIFCSPHIGHO2_01_52_17 TaxID=1817820 RepID=A0A1F5NAW4_9BACT|nr:MAG: hypothetical protein A3K06_03750 [Candidatus Doudnabacteria bacterium RIFCSPHIGHO2_01_52_17]
MALGRFFLVLVALVSAPAPILSRILQSQEWDPFQAVAMRGLVGALILGFLFHAKITEIKRDVVGTLVASVALMFGQTFYIYSTQHGSLGIIISLLYLGPVWTVALERFFLKIPRRGSLVACALGFVGTLLIAFGFDWSKETEWVGVITSVLGSLAYAWFMISGNRMAQVVSPETVAFFGTAATGIIWSWTLWFAPWSLVSLQWASLFGVVNGALYFFLLYSAMHKINSASEVAIWMYLEVPVIWLVGILMYQEGANLYSLLGAGLIVAAGVLSALWNK